MSYNILHNQLVQQTFCAADCMTWAVALQLYKNKAHRACLHLGKGAGNICLGIHDASLRMRIAVLLCQALQHQCILGCSIFEHDDPIISNGTSISGGPVIRRLSPKISCGTMLSEHQRTYHMPKAHCL